MARLEKFSPIEFGVGKQRVITEDGRLFLRCIKGNLHFMSGKFFVRDPKIADTYYPILEIVREEIEYSDKTQDYFRTEGTVQGHNIRRKINVKEVGTIYLKQEVCYT